ncbi:MAG: hypothetical protein HOP09_14410 [Hyphomicrobium sp.]|nr:hypothetical protein [Hyphomicrobium sp.]
MANPYIDVLKGQSWLDVGQDAHIKYYFHFDPTIGGRMWTTAEKDGFTAAAQTWANVANVTFDQVLFPNQAEWKEGLYASSTIDILIGSGALAAHELPDAIGTASGYFDGDGAANGYGVGHLGASPLPGTLSFETFVHEIGHGLGLNHPHADMPGELAFPGVTDPFDTGDLGLNQTVYTVMSYNDFSDQSSAVEYILNGHISGPMAFDIAAIQQMYGANTTFNLGDTVYAIDDATGLVPFWKCLWDAGGIDEMSYAGSDSVVLDLRAATLLSEAGGGGYVSSEQSPIMRGGFTIANGVVIENARGGSGSDSLTGNDASNVLTGNGSDDTLNGGLGIDTLLGGSGNDVLDGGDGFDILTGGSGDDIYILNDVVESMTELADEGSDTIQAGFAADLASFANFENFVFTGTSDGNLTGTSADNRLTGNSGVNVITGGGGNDTLTGGGAIDTLNGGLGDDTFVVGADADVISDDGGIDTIISTVTRALQDASVVLENITLEGNAAANATGNAQANILIGNGGINILNGRGGADTMTGGLGNDIFIVDNMADKAFEAVGQGTNDYVYATNSFALAAGQEIEGLSANPQAGTNPINLTGNEFRQIIRGNNGTNTLLGGGGNDSLYGYGGNDTIESQAGNDSLFGGTGVDRFQFRQSQLGAASGVDRIYDFTAADYIKIDTASVLSERALLSTEFAAGTTALDASDRVIYDQVSGAVWFDADGTGAQAKILFAVLDTKPAVTAADILLF